MATPSPRLLRAAADLFDDPAERQAFVSAVMAGESKEQAIILVRDAPATKVFPKLGPEPWQPEWVMRLQDGFRPGKHPLHNQGAYYVLDFSSVFSASAMLAIAEPPRRVLDLCAAPGGKAVFAWRAFRPELLACNETIRKRTGSLISNLDRCGVESGLVWSADPSVWAKRYPNAFDLVIVDAPCSGQSLLAKGMEAPGCFSPQTIDVCVGRQRRIVANAWQCVAPGGHLLYATCTYAYKENEKVVSWLAEQMGDAEAIAVPGLSRFRSPYVPFPCYRLFPQQGLGAGAFVALLRKNAPEGERGGLDVESMPKIWRFGEPAQRQVDKPPRSAAPPPPPAPRKPRRPRR